MLTKFRSLENTKNESTKDADTGYEIQIAPCYHHGS